MRHRTLIALLSGLLAVLPAWALDFQSAAERAVMFDAPSLKGKPLYIVARGTPLEVVVTLDTWVKVRDEKGDLGWIEKRQLAEQRTVIIRTDRAQIWKQASETSPLVVEAEKDVVLDLLEPGPFGWAQVRHRDGAQGFVRASQVWGL